MGQSVPRSFRAFSICVFGAAFGAAAVLFANGDRPSAIALFIFGGLTIYSESKSVAVSESIVISAGWMIGMAAIVAFHDEHSLLGPLLIGFCIAVHVPHIRARQWYVLGLNAGILGLAMLAAAVGYAVVADSISTKMPIALAAPAFASVCHLLVLWPLLAVAHHLRDRVSMREILADFVPATVQFLSFSVVGYLLGRLYVSLGAAVLVLIVVPILIAREMFASYIHVKESHEETVGMLIRALEAKDRYTSGHSERVATYAKYMGEQLNFMPTRLERLRFAALMHDIGKLVVPNHLLNKPGRLTEDEFAQVRLHEKVSVQMLSHIDFLRPIAAASHSDATRFDPDDGDHPIEPYIVMIADAYDAMTSTRAYRKALPQDVAFQELRDKAGVQFHPACVEALIVALEAKGEHHGAGYEVQDEFADAPDAGLGSAGLGDLLPTDATN